MTMVESELHEKNVNSCFELWFPVISYAEMYSAGYAAAALSDY